MRLSLCDWFVSLVLPSSVTRDAHAGFPTCARSDPLHPFLLVDPSCAPSILDTVGVFLHAFPTKEKLSLASRVEPRVTPPPLIGVDWHARLVAYVYAAFLRGLDVR